MATLCFFLTANAQDKTVKSDDPVPEGGIVIGDKLPPSFWNLRLNLVNHPQGRTSVRLSDFKDKLLVLDFWATYCVPCVESVDKWNELQPKFAYEVAVIPIYLYQGNDKALPFAQKKGWKLPVAVGNAADTLLNRLFYAHRSYGQVWIKDGKLLAIPKNSVVNAQLVAKVITNRKVVIEMNDLCTYFDKRYQFKKD